MWSSRCLSGKILHTSLKIHAVSVSVVIAIVMVMERSETVKTVIKVDKIMFHN